MKQSRDKSADHLLTVQEAGDILRLHPRTVMNMARRGELPGCKIGKQWRFARQSVENWLVLRLGNAEPSLPNSNGSHDVPLPDSICDILNPRCIKIVDELEGSDEVLEDLALLLCRVEELSDFRSILDILRERENMCSTAMDGGIAFPHPRHPITSLSRSTVAILVVRNGVDFGAPDKERTYVFMCSFSINEGAHLKLIAKMVHLFRNHGTVDALKDCRDSADIIREIGRIESEIANISSQSGVSV